MNNKFKLLPLSIALAAVLSPLSASADDSLTFSGYARYGALYATDNDLVDFGDNDRTIGRLGNEHNGGEFLFNKAYTADTGAKWDVAVMLNHWAVDAWGSTDGVNIPQFYAAVTNFVEDQPDLYVWAGRKFHQRPQQGLNDHYILTHDGQGAGFENLDLGSSKLDMGFIAQVSGNAGAALGNDSGKYAITAKLHDIALGDTSLDLYADYGFTSDAAGADDGKESGQAVAVLNLKGPINKIVARYAYNSLNSAFQLTGNEQNAIYFSFEGGANPSENLYVDYLMSVQSITNNDIEDKLTVAGIVRPMYNWDKTHSTWLEAGYGLTDQDGGDAQAWKLTVSQNVSLGGLPWSRPMLRFYSTVGSVDYSDEDRTEDTLSFGAMFEAWW